MPTKKALARKELVRLNSLVSYEREARSLGYSRIAGIDEAGRGPLAGSVVAAACIIPEGIFFPGIDDCKKLTPQVRDKIYAEIVGHPEVVYAVGVLCASEIDRVNIYQATIIAMQQAISELAYVPDYLLVDGMALPHQIPCKKIIGGDGKSQSIAAASIIAKVTRDNLAMDWEVEWPEYGFGSHKGYATARHLAAIEAHGPCPIHRMSFAPFKPKLSP